MIEIRNPQHTDVEHLIDCEINHPDYGWIPFAASINDVEPHGREIYSRIMAGECGEIAPAQRDFFDGQFEFERQAKVGRVNQFCSNPLDWQQLTPEQQQAAADYRAALLALTFEESNNWPQVPEFLR